MHEIDGRSTEMHPHSILRPRDPALGGTFACVPYSVYARIYVKSTAAGPKCVPTAPTDPEIQLYCVRALAYMRVYA